LRNNGVSVVLFDKEKRPGGRLSTWQHHDRQFDHGVQYLRPHSRRTALLFSEWRKAGLITPWHALAYELPQRKKVDTTSWHVATPSQNSLAKHLAQDLHIISKFNVVDISGEKGRWSIIGQKNRSAGPFGTVFVTCPADQAAHLLKPFPNLCKDAVEAERRPCLATMVEFEEEVIVDYDAAFVSQSPLAWVCRDSAKPKRPKRECWVLHASQAWSREHIDDPPERVASLMLSAFAPLCMVELPPVNFCRAHRWRFAFGNSLDHNSNHAYNADLGLAVAGDWCTTANVEGAYWSGQDLAESYLKTRESPGAQKALQE